MTFDIVFVYLLFVSEEEKDRYTQKPFVCWIIPRYLQSRGWARLEPGSEISTWASTRVTRTQVLESFSASQDIHKHGATTVEHFALIPFCST